MLHNIQNQHRNVERKIVLEEMMISVDCTMLMHCTKNQVFH